LKAVIVIAHPDRKALEHKNIVPTIKMSYKKKGLSVEVLNLYNDGYSPSMFIGDISNINNNAFAKAYRNSIKQADHVYIISPTRWISLDPLIEGFIDQVFTKGFAFNQRSPLLKRKKLVIITTSTSNKSLKWKTCNLLWIRMRLMVFPKIFGFKNIKMFQIWDVKSMSRLELTKKLLTIQKYIAKSFSDS
jgi:putative NADPH-quinone reductase